MFLLIPFPITGLASNAISILDDVDFERTMNLFRIAESYAALCFWKLALNYSNHDELMADAYTQTIFKIARCIDVDIRRLPVSMLLALSRSEIYKINIAQRDGLNDAIGFLADDDLLVKLCAVDVLC